MAGAPAPEDVERFAAEARSAGLAQATARRMNPRLALVAFAVVVAASLTVGYSTGWMTLSRPHANPLSELPGCSDGGVAVQVATEAGGAGALPGLWASVSSSFSSATGGCLSVASTSTPDGFSVLSGTEADALVGPLLPGPSSPGDLPAATYDVPLFVAPVVVLVDAQGVGGELNLSVAALAGAYLGTVTTWASPLVTGPNPGLRAVTNVSVGYVEGPSEATAVFSSYLAQGNATFQGSVSPGPNVSWPVGDPAATVAALVAWVATTPGAIAYAPGEVCSTLPATVLCADLESGSGSFVAPTPAAVAAAAAVEANSSAAVAGDWTNATGVAPTGSSVYPMVETTYAVLYRDLGVAYGSLLGLNASKWLIALVYWIASDTAGTAGQLAGEEGYAPLPGSLATMAEETALSVTYLGSWILLPPSSVQEGNGEGGEGGGGTDEF